MTFPSFKRRVSLRILTAWYFGTLSSYFERLKNPHCREKNKRTRVKDRASIWRFEMKSLRVYELCRTRDCEGHAMLDKTAHLKAHPSTGDRQKYTTYVSFARSGKSTSFPSFWQSKRWVSEQLGHTACGHELCCSGRVLPWWGELGLSGQFVFIWRLSVNLSFVKCGVVLVLLGPLEETALQRGANSGVIGDMSCKGLI